MCERYADLSIQRCFFRIHGPSICYSIRPVWQWQIPWSAARYVCVQKYSALQLVKRMTDGETGTRVCDWASDCLESADNSRLTVYPSALSSITLSFHSLLSLGDSAAQHRRPFLQTSVGLFASFNSLFSLTSPSEPSLSKNSKLTCIRIRDAKNGLFRCWTSWPKNSSSRNKMPWRASSPKL